MCISKMYFNTVFWLLLNLQEVHEVCTTIYRQPFKMSAKPVELVDDVDSDEEEENLKASAKVVEPEVVEDATLANPDVVTKYQETAKIVQAALVEVTARVFIHILVVS